VSVRVIEKIPTSKLFEMEQCLFVIKFEVERDLGGVNANNDDDGQDSQAQAEEEEELGDDFEQIDKARNVGASGMDTDTHTPGNNRGVQQNTSHHANVQSLEASVMEKVMGKSTFSKVPGLLKRI
jgi:hypothetical protein